MIARIFKRRAACASNPNPRSPPTLTQPEQPKYIVNIVTGASGDKEGETPCAVNILPPSITCTPDYGFGIFTALNASVATWTFKAVKPDWLGPSNYTDDLMIVKTRATRR